MNERERIQWERLRLRAEYGKLFDKVANLLFQHDPIGINFESNTDEYESEAGTILPRLKTCGSVLEVRKMVHEEFIHWFDAGIAGAESNYDAIAQKLWELWQNYQASKR